MKKRILICDDDEDILAVCKTILERNDFQVSTSLTCESIFNKMSVINPDLILMDLWIPEMGGEKATLKLKTDEGTKHIPVILFSANQEIGKMTSKLNANDFIVKPFDMRDLVAKINKHLSASPEKPKE
jgi:DNA-binding response OmpR family regulator